MPMLLTLATPCPSCCMCAGTIGFYACLLFTRKIYAAVKID